MVLWGSSVIHWYQLWARGRGKNVCTGSHSPPGLDEVSLRGAPVTQHFPQVLSPIPEHHAGDPDTQTWVRSQSEQGAELPTASTLTTFVLQWHSSLSEPCLLLTSTSLSTGSATLARKHLSPPHVQLLLLQHLPWVSPVLCKKY